MDELDTYYFRVPDSRFNEMKETIIKLLEMKRKHEIKSVLGRTVSDHDPINEYYDEKIEQIRSYKNTPGKFMDMIIKPLDHWTKMALSEMLTYEMKIYISIRYPSKSMNPFKE